MLKSEANEVLPQKNLIFVPKCFFSNLKGNSKTIKKQQNIMKEKVLQAMREAGKPISAGDVTKALGADRKEVDKAFAELKKEGAIVSPIRCKWEPAK